MRSRMLREGSVGLLILAGIGALGISLAWLRGFNPANRNFKVIVSFPTIAGVQSGSTVRYRGVSIGRITDIRPSAKGVDVEISIGPADLIIPANSEVTIDQSGLLGENVLNINPPSQEVPQVAARPLDGDCDKSLILCDGSQISGDLGISTDALIKSTIRFADLYGQPEFYGNLNQLTANSGKAAAEIATMSKEFGILARAFRREIATLSGTANSFSSASDRIGLAATEIGVTANKTGQRVDQLAVTLEQVNGLIRANRSSLVSTLDNINATSGTLRVAVDRLPAAIARFERSRLITDLEILSANAAAASQNLRTASESFSNPTTIATLQQTLNAARATFENAQKITADLDEITGDPVIRNQFKDVIRGFGELLSSSQQLQQRTAYARQLEPTAQQLASQKRLMQQRPVRQSSIQSPLTMPAQPVQPQLAAQSRPPIALQQKPQDSLADRGISPKPPGPQRGTILPPAMTHAQPIVVEPSAQ